MKKIPAPTLYRTLRLQHHYTQDYVAIQIGISRASYLSLEKGSRELMFKEAVALTQLYGITLDSLTHSSITDTKKYSDMIRLVLRVAATEKTVIKKTKLSQILYLAEMRHYYQNGVSISGMPYRRQTFGPTVDSYLGLIETLEHSGIIVITQVLRDDYHMYEIAESTTSQKQPLTTLTSRETKTIQAVAEVWGPSTTAHITHFIEEQLPYREASPLQLIDYKRILDEAGHKVS